MSGAEGEAAATAAEPVGKGARWDALLLGVAMLASTAILLALSFAVPEGLDVRSEIIGYPSFNDFDITRYRTIYSLWLLGLPILSLLLFQLFRRHLGTPEGPWWQMPVIAWHPPRHTLENLLTRPRVILLSAVSLSGPVALFILSSLTHVTIEATGEAVAYPWFPLWLAGLLTLAVGLVIRKRSAWLPGLAIISGGTALAWFVTGGIPGALGPMDYFHEGEMLVPGLGLLEGKLPWRDLQMIHGPWFDAMRGAIGQAVFERSRWGAIAGIHAIINPLYFATWFWFFGWLFRRNWLQAALATLLLACVDPFIHVRFMLLAPLWLATGWYLALPGYTGAHSQRALIRAAMMVLTGSLFVLGTPEAVFAPLVVAVIVLARDLSEGDKDAPPLQRFPATLTAVFAAVPVVGLLLFLLFFNGMLDRMLAHFLVLSKDYALTVGIPASLNPGAQIIALYGLIIAVLAVAAITVQGWQLWRGGRLEPRQWVLLASGLFVALYLQKVVNRFDGHVFHVLAAAAPLMGWALVRVLAALERRLAGAVGRWQPLMLLALVTISLTGAAAVDSQREQMRARWAAPAPDLLFWNKLANWQPVVAHAPVIKKLGYATDEAEHDPVYKLWQQAVIDNNLQNVAVLDITNRPGLFHYLLGLTPASSYFYVAMAQHEYSMDRIRADIDRIRANPQGSVAAIVPTLPGWDGINDKARHHRLIGSLYNRMVPLKKIGSTVLFVHTPDVDGDINRRDASLFSQLGDCDWGYSPAYIEPPRSVVWEPIEPERRKEAASIDISGWAIDAQVMRPAESIRFLHGDDVFVETQPNLERPDLVKAFGNNERILYAGFAQQLTVPYGWADDIRAQAQMRDGRFLPLTQDHAIQGGIDKFEVTGGRDLALVDYAGNAPNNGAWLRIEGTAPGQKIHIRVQPAWERRVGGFSVPLRMVKPAHLSADRAMYIPLTSCGLAGSPLEIWVEPRAPLGDIKIWRNKVWSTHYSAEKGIWRE